MSSVSSEPGASQRTGLIKQPLDLELPVVAMGARPGDTSEKRELFTESTETVLVFENGCVIALAAAVAVGQLVFLTNRETGKEIVTQVLRKRSFRPTDCYVELEFTEPAPNFWGVEFPNVETPLKMSVAEGSGAATVAEAEVTEEDTQQVVAPPDAVEVERLRKEVEALKAQLKSLTPTQDFVGQKAEEVKQETKEIPPQEPQQTSPEAVSTGSKSEEAKTEQQASATDNGSYPIRMQLPKADPNAAAERGGEFAADATALAAVHAAEGQLPEPSLDFDKFPGAVREKTKLFSGKATKSLSGPIGALIALVLFLVAGGILTYRMGWMPKFGGKSSKSDPGKSAFGAAAGTKPSSGEVTTPKSTNSANANAMSEGTSQPPVEHTAPNATVNSATVQPTGNVSMPGNSANKKPEHASASAGSNKKNPNSKTGVKETPEVVAPQNEVVVPPKLLKAIKSLSPPEALRRFVSGTVTLDALVDETGHVQSATPVAGPKALYPKAIETVKEYLYQPATKGGQPVQAHAEVKIQFWYEP